MPVMILAVESICKADLGQVPPYAKKEQNELEALVPLHSWISPVDEMFR